MWPYWYVDKDVTLSVKGKTQTNSGNGYGGDSCFIQYYNAYCTLTTITNDFNLAFKKGWNTVYIKRQYSYSEASTPKITQTDSNVKIAAVVFYRKMSKNKFYNIPTRTK
jgi:hypothetical protein